MTRSYLAVPVLPLLVAALLSSATVAEAREYHYVAHQGNVGSSTYKDNSLEAFQYAAKQPALYGIETDIFKTNKGDYICMHTAESDKAKWGGKDLTDMTLSEIKKVTSGGCHVASLAEYLEVCKSNGKWAYIQLQQTAKSKKRAYIDGVLEILHDKGMLEQCCFTGSKNKVVGLAMAEKRAKARYKVDVRTSLSAGTGNVGKLAIDAAIKKAQRYGLDGIALYANKLNKSNIKYACRQARKYGLEVRGNGTGSKTGTEKKARTFAKYGCAVVYTAHFKPATYKVEFVGNAGTIAVATVGYGGTAALPDADAIAQQTKEGYTFSKWDSTAYKNVKEDVTVTAVYKKSDAPANQDANQNSGETANSENETTSNGNTASSPPGYLADGNGNAQAIGDSWQKADPGNTSGIDETDASGNMAPTGLSRAH